jgi:RND family efflux transporter MFP subunit
MGRRFTSYLISAIILVFFLLSGAPAQESSSPPWLSEPPDLLISESGEAGDKKTAQAVVEATVIESFRSADVGAEVGGTIDAVNFEEGDLIKKGDVVVVLDRKRYELEAKKARARVEGLEKSLRLMNRQARIREDLYRSDSLSLVQLLQSQQERERIQTELEQARIELARAEADFEDCEVKAPFTGYLATKHKQPHETVRMLEPLFMLVDSERVYAVARVKRQFLHKFKEGDSAVFVLDSGKKFEGTIDRVEKVLDQSTQTSQVWVEIDNREGRLDVGSVGELILSK